MGRVLRRTSTKQRCIYSIFQGGTSAIVAGDHYTYDARPTLSAASPAAGPTTGGNTVTINGTNFTSGAGVKFGTTASATVTFVSATQLTAVAPAHAAGTIDVTVTTPGGTSAIVAGDHYAYGSPTVTSFTPTSGMTGSTVTINGTGFVAGATVKFGTKPAGSVTFVSGTQIKAIVPNGAVTAKIGYHSGGHRDQRLELHCNAIDHWLQPGHGPDWDGGDNQWGRLQ